MRDDLRMSGGARGRAVEIFVDGEAVAAFEGESLAAAMIAAGLRAGRWTAGNAPRGYYCGTGACQECLVIADGWRDVRACMTTVREGLRVERQREPLGGEVRP